MVEKIKESKEMEEYFSQLDNNLHHIFKLAASARKKGFDPEKKVDIPLAQNMAERVEGLISAVAPEIVGKGLSKRIIELEKKYGVAAWEVAFKIAEEVAREKFCKFDNKKMALEVGIRVGFLYHTAGIVAAPLEGFLGLEIKKTREGKEYFAPLYAGPIRGAGGTAAAFSVLLTDYIRGKFGYAKYDPDEKEVNRFVTELDDYHEKVTNLQYKPSAEEVRFLVQHLPVEVEGSPSEKKEVSNYKDLKRVPTNRIRGGLCLVMAEGLAQKAPKLWKRIVNFPDDFGLEWDFIGDFLELQKRIKAKRKEKKEEDGKKLEPNYVFIHDLVAGRPVLSYPLAQGGFRLRYGRSRFSGYSAAGLHPATMFVLKRFIALGTQLKIERPGKATAITLCDSLDGPIVKLTNGSVKIIQTVEEARRVEKDVEEILFLGDILFNFGDFSENNHSLVPAGYCPEWWVQELEKATVDLFGNLDFEKLSDLVRISVDRLDLLTKNFFTHFPSFFEASLLSKKLKIPLHPKFTFFWSALSPEDLLSLFDWFASAKLVFDERARLLKIIVPSKNDSPQKHLLELIGFPHEFVNQEFVVIKKPLANLLLSLFDFNDDGGWSEITKKAQQAWDKLKQEKNSSTLTALDVLNQFSPFILRDKAGTFIGARMGRPEKAKMRKMTGSPHCLFPVGQEGGRLRSFQEALNRGKITSHFPTYHCKHCQRDTVYPLCEVCFRPTKRFFHCPLCGKTDKDDCHELVRAYKSQELDIRHYFNQALKTIGLTPGAAPQLIKGVRGTSNKDHTPENFIKGVLRAKHSIFVNKDGTTRYDMTELPLTHFKPKEISTSVDKLKELGYLKDIHGQPLEDPDQVLELRPQDVILPTANKLGESADDVLFRTAAFVDELLERLYQKKPFYNLDSREDLAGQLLIGLAPHISAGILCRLVGFSNIQAMIAHPLLHAAMRRDCDGDEACVILLLDAFLNFSRQYLPDKIGTRTMDAPLVLTSKLVPSEVDDMVHGIDVVWQYPLDFYQAAQEFKMPFEFNLEQLKSRLNTPQQYENFGFTHPISHISKGVLFSTYKTLPTMVEKLSGQMELAEKIRAVNVKGVAALVIERHFVPDTKGNLRKFSLQGFRCVGCNEKYRRPPIFGRCLKCKGRIIFTISEGSIVKYLGLSHHLAEKYDLSPYLRQSLDLLQARVEAVFGREKERQEGLSKWVSKSSS